LIFFKFNFSNCIVGRPNVQLNTPLNIKRETVNDDPLTLNSSKEPIEIPYSSEPMLFVKSSIEPNISTGTSLLIKDESLIKSEVPVDIFSSIEDLTNDFLKECSYQPVDTNNFQTNIIGMKKFANMNMWKNVLELSNLIPIDISSLLTSNLDQEKLSILSLRYESLFRLKMFDEICNDVGIILSNWDKIIPTSLQISSDIFNRNKEDFRISLTILYSETQFMIGHGNESLGQLYVLRLYLSKKNTKGISYQSIWEFKLSISIINMLIKQHQWNNAIEEIKNAIIALQSKNNVSENQLCEIALLCKLARTYIHIGNILQAENYLEIAKKSMENYKGLNTAQKLNIEDYLVITGGILLQSKNKVD